MTATYDYTHGCQRGRPHSEARKRREKNEERTQSSATHNLSIDLISSGAPRISVIAIKIKHFISVDDVIENYIDRRPFFCCVCARVCGISYDLLRCMVSLSHQIKYETTTRSLVARVFRLAAQLCKCHVSARTGVLVYV